MFATAPDLLRLLAVPVFGWAAYRDLRTRRVPNRTWYPLVAVGLACLAWDAWSVAGAVAVRQRLFAVHLAVSLGIVVPMAYGFWRFGGFGGADAKAFMVLALLFPEYPAYYLATAALPLVRTTLGVFSLTVVTNAVLVGAAYPLALGARNALAGHRRVRALVGRPVRWDDLERTHGRLLEDRDGFTRAGLDLDALRMYLRWRDTTLAALREDPGLADPATVPEETGDPTDGALADGGVDAAPPAATPAARDAAADAGDGDRWGAAAFCDAVDGAYGTTPAQLRAGLDVVTDRDAVWVSPGIPFVVPLFAGLLVALVYGDLLFAALRAVALA
ncbi:MAG: prepilin peptidase [Halobacteriaceae archaeon]